MCDLRTKQPTTGLEFDETGKVKVQFNLIKLAQIQKHFSGAMETHKKSTFKFYLVFLSIHISIYIFHV